MPPLSVVATTVGRALGRRLYQERWLLAIFLGALITRLHWNEAIHPPGEYIYSDMNGYVQRADRLLERGLVPHEYDSFFPFGTHWLVAGVKYVWGVDNYVAVGRVYALLGAIAVACAYAIARRASRFATWVAPAVGLLGIFYYPHLSLGGYILSEVPYTAFFMLALVFLMRMLDHGRYVDALAMGTAVAIAMVFRPQALLSAAPIGLFWILRRKQVPNLKIWGLLVAFIPVVIGLALSSALLHHNTGRRGLISENGSFNLVFGRCHNSKIQSMPDGKGHGRVHFRPPPFLQLTNLAATKKKAGEKPSMALQPAIDDVLTYKGYIGDRDKHMEFVRECIERTGWWGQVKYSYTNVALLWHNNIPWPDSGRKQWRPITRWWTRRVKEWVLLPTLLGLILLVPRRTARMGFLASNILAMIALAAIYFGGTRHRGTYDMVVLVVVAEVYAYVLWLLGTRALALTKRLHPKFMVNAGYADGDLSKSIYMLSEFLSERALSLNGYTGREVPTGAMFAGVIWLPRPDNPLAAEIVIPQGAPMSPRLINLQLGTMLKLNFQLSYLKFDGGWDLLGMIQFRYSHFPK